VACISTNTDFVLVRQSTMISYEAQPSHILYRITCTYPLHCSLPFILTYTQIKFYLYYLLHQATMTAVGFTWTTKRTPPRSKSHPPSQKVASSEPKTPSPLMRTNKEQFIIDCECQKNDHERVMNRWRMAFFSVKLFVFAFVIYVVTDIFSKVHCTCPPESRAVMKITSAIKAIPVIKATPAIKAAAPTIHARRAIQWVSLDLRLYFPTNLSMLKPQQIQTTLNYEQLKFIIHDYEQTLAQSSEN
jgi:hypothetical protein